MHSTITTTMTITIMISAAAFLLPPAAASSNSTENTEFVRRSCAATLYPELCFSSLHPHSSSAARDPAKLAKIAISLALSSAKRAASFVANVSRHQAEYGAEDSRAASAVSDCSATVGDAVDEIRGSLRQMRAVGGAAAAVRFQVSNVQTWMSAALTDEETCTDGFEEVEEGPVKDEVYGRIGDVKKLTSNALALVNVYARQVVPGTETTAPP